MYSLCRSVCILFSLYPCLLCLSFHTSHLFILDDGNELFLYMAGAEVTWAEFVGVGYAAAGGVVVLLCFTPCHRSHSIAVKGAMVRCGLLLHIQYILAQIYYLFLAPL